MIKHMWPWPKKRKTEADTTRRLSRNQKFFERLCTSRDKNLDSSDLRMVIMDNDAAKRSSKRVVYDSSTVLPVLPGEILTPDARVSECRQFKLLRKKKDVSNLAQLVWGSGPTFHGVEALKFHHLPDERLMISRVFPMSRSIQCELYHQTESVSSDSESQYTPTVRSIDTLGLSSIRSNLNNTAPPEKFHRVRNSSLNIESDESDEFRAFSPPHRLSKNRRIQMSHCSSLCEPITSPLNIRKPRSRMSSIGSQPDDGGGYGSFQDERQVALAVIFTHAQRSFVFQHIPLIEAEMCRLEQRIATAALYSKGFLENVHRAWNEFNTAVCLLFNTPRLRQPVWLSLYDRQQDENNVSEIFCEQLAILVNKFDTKETNYFLSNLVSTVLMYHMSWVASVATPTCGGQVPMAKMENRFIHGTIYNDELGSVAYNPHIAQFLEISGNIGNINRNTKAVVCGSDEDAEIISHLLQMLSYFIRCSAVQASQKGRESDPLPVFRSFSPEMVGSPESSNGDLSAFSPEKGSMKMECDMSLYTEPPDLLIETVAKLDTIDTVDFLGRSLLAGPSTTFSPHFIISGLIREGSNIDKAFERMCDDVRYSYESHSVQRASSSLSSQASSSYELQGPDSVIVIADVSENSVKVLTAEGMGIAHTPSESIVSMFEAFKTLQGVGTAPKFLLCYLEDTLHAVLSKSLGLVELVSSEPDDLDSTEAARAAQQSLEPERVRRVLGCDHSDLRLILNVASVYYPCVLSSVS